MGVDAQRGAGLCVIPQTSQLTHTCRCGMHSYMDVYYMYMLKIVQRIYMYVLYVLASIYLHCIYTLRAYCIATESTIKFNRCLPLSTGE